MKNIILSFTLLFSVLFSVAQSAETSPRVVFGDLKHDGPYDRSEILLQEKLTVSSGDGNMYQVISYKLTISPATGKPTRFEVQGNKLPAKLQGALNQIVGGDKILIESVFAMVNEDKYDITELESITLEVKKFQSEDPYESAWDSDAKKPEVVLSNTDNPYATFGSIEADGMPKRLEEILEQSQILVKSEGNVVYTVTRFKMITAYKNSPPTLASTSGNKITENMVKMMNRLQSGDRILIEGITATAEVDGTTYRVNLSPIIITVR